MSVARLFATVTRVAEARIRNLGRRAALRTLAGTLDRDRLDEAELAAWLTALNDLRLVLGTRLDVGEELGRVDPGDPRAPALSLYAYLSWLQEQAVEAAAAAL